GTRWRAASRPATSDASARDLGRLRDRRGLGRAGVGDRSVAQHVQSECGVDRCRDVRVDERHRLAAWEGGRLLILEGHDVAAVEPLLVELLAALGAVAADLD